MSDTLFDKIGGDAAVNAAVDIFYRKVISNDLVGKYFVGIDMKAQAQKQKGFLTMAFGGQNKYSGKNLREGHSHLVMLGLNDSHFDAVVDMLASTLKELGVVDELVGEVVTFLETTRKDILGR